METNLVEKTVEVNLQKIENYLNKLSGHVYLTEREKFFKVFPVNFKEKLCYATLEFDGVNCYFRISGVDVCINNYGNSSKSVLSNVLFPQHFDKRISIPNFKLMREKILEVEKLVAEKFDGKNDREIQKEIEVILAGLTVKKKEE